MTQSSSTEPAGAQAFLAVCGNTHLFPGARCRVQGLSDPTAFAADPRPVELELRLSDDVVTEAELHPSRPVGPVLTVSAYTTGAGTTIEARTWLIREFARRGDDIELTIGGRAAT
ncbi:hypothetical protein GCM10010331_23430 [Streptomyces xanthochromogenes]|uniref:hypothetical protein n=1 Tax=Streptomyces xanthochromogenes TaxID=67384 RepID=UPI0016783F94|nr:hypothetical protein [Streptomyces xanthochromogenes]GHB35395.1 hypothetical protein GCM10010331_23430 [Streptomyces xanthochromogenes]